MRWGEGGEKIKMTTPESWTRVWRTIVIAVSNASASALQGLTHRHALLCESRFSGSLAARFAGLLMTSPCKYARRYALRGPLCAYRRLAIDFSVSHSSIRGFGDSRTIEGDGMVLTNRTSATTEVTASTEEAATRCRPSTLSLDKKYAHMRI
jgi:hypothetical protein